MIAGVDKNERYAPDAHVEAGPKPCCAKIRRTWCALPDGHGGPHLSYVLAKRFAPHLAIARKAIET